MAPISKAIDQITLGLNFLDLAGSIESLGLPVSARIQSDKSDCFCIVLAQFIARESSRLYFAVLISSSTDSANLYLLGPDGFRFIHDAFRSANTSPMNARGSVLNLMVIVISRLSLYKRRTFISFLRAKQDCAMIILSTLLRTAICSPIILQTTPFNASKQAPRCPASKQNSFHRQ